MTLQALLVSTDDSASDVLGRVLPTFGIAMDRSSDPETTLARIQQQKFEALIVDFDNPELADKRTRGRRRQLGTSPLSIALVADTAKVRRHSERRGALCAVQTDLRRSGESRIARGCGFVEPRAAPGRPDSGAGAGGDHAAGHAQDWMAFFWICLKPAWKCSQRNRRLSGSLLAFRFQLPDGDCGNRGAWAGGMGESQRADGRSLSRSFREPPKSELKAWLQSRGRGSTARRSMRPYRIAS